MKIDCHVHTSEISLCGFASAEEQIQTAIRKGLDAIVLTDHETLFPMEEIEKFNMKYEPFKIFQGIELRIGPEEEWEDVIVIGIHNKVLGATTWSYPRLHRYVARNGGFLILVNPYRSKDYIAAGVDIEKYKPHAIEVSATNLNPEGLDKRIALAESLGVHIITNSDSHNVENIGSYYNTLGKTPKDEKELVKMLKAGEYKVQLEKIK